MSNIKKLQYPTLSLADIHKRIGEESSDLF